jgi:HPt (histidine-containing phosphotransfer) domain-containing protein
MLTKGVADANQNADAGAADPAIFDREHLSQYTGGDGALERELIGLFLAQFAPVRTQLDEAASADDWKFAAHSLKGSARSIGAPRIAAVTEELEDLGWTGEAKRKKSLLADLDQAMAAFAAEAEKLLA